MKRIYYIIFVLSFSMSSCKDFLDTKPSDAITPVNYYETEAQLKFGLAAVYDILGNIYGTVMLYRYGLEADEGYYTGAPASGTHAYNFTSSDPSIESYWNNLYVGVSRANLILDNVNKNTSISEGIRTTIRGEALFLRAYFYFILVQTYGEVPLVLKSVASPSQIDLAKSPVKEVYEQILKDMIEAEQLVSPIKTLNFSGAVNKSAVRGMLARVCLYMAGKPLGDHSKYEQASYWAKMVMDDTQAGHALNPNFSDVFINYAKDAYEIKESIFEVEYWGNRTGGFAETGQVGTVNGPASANAATGVAVGGLKASNALYSSFEEGDVRRDWCIANFTYNSTGVSGAKTFIALSTPASIYNRFSGKFRREYELVTPKASQWTPQNMPLLRFSDVLLMFAEAENEWKGAPTQAAIDAVNLVRRRAWSKGGIKTVTVVAGGSGYTSAPTVTITGSNGNKGALATATVVNGVVTTINLAADEVTGKKRGSDYALPVTVTIIGGGGTGAAATATINTVADAELTPLQGSSQLEFRKLIQSERSRELCYELLRKPDLIRWGIFVPVMNATGNAIQADVPTAVYFQRFKNVMDKHNLWPIPDREIATNRALVQNPDWGL